MKPKRPIPPSFTVKKNAILVSLATPESKYTDLSPKGSVDAAIKSLIDRINGLEGVVTTSSCAGRVSVFLEGRKQGKVNEGRGNTENNEGPQKDSEQVTVPGGKGMGGKWLFVSHEPIELFKSGERKELLSELLGLGSLGAQNEAQAFCGDVSEMRLVRFQFEPMVRRCSSDGNGFKVPIQCTMMLHMLKRDVDSPYHDRFSTPFPTHSRRGHQCWVSRKRHPEPQELGRSQRLSYGCYPNSWSRF